MDVKKNHLLVGKERVYDPDLIYVCVIGLLATSREINFNDALAFELAAYPLSMFNADGKMNVVTSKSTIKHKLQATVSEHNLTAFLRRRFQALRRANIILVLDRYFHNSTNSFTRTQRS